MRPAEWILIIGIVEALFGSVDAFLDEGLSLDQAMAERRWTAIPKS